MQFIACNKAQHLVQVKSGVQICDKVAEIRTKTRFFFPGFQFSLKLHKTIDCNNVQQLAEIKPTKKFFLNQIRAKTGQNQAKNQFFSHFLNFGSLAFLYILHRTIAWKNNVQLLVERKISKNFWGLQIWVKQAKIGSKIGFFAIFSRLVHQFLLKLHRIIASNNI